jgi:hypothetical protein
MESVKSRRSREPAMLTNEQAKHEGRVAGPMNLSSFVTALQPFVDEFMGRITGRERAPRKPCHLRPIPGNAIAERASCPPVAANELHPGRAVL